MSRTTQHSASRPVRRIVRWAECCFWIAGIAALGYCAFFYGRMALDQYLGARQIAKAPSSSDQSKPVEGNIVGFVEVPRLGVSAVVFEGTSDRTLARGVGHFTGSAEPGQTGNVVLAAHRDTFFRPLRDVRDGDRVAVFEGNREFDYVVDSTLVVNPDAMEVVAPTVEPTITLITCYPFRFIGNAPQRFIVRGRQISTSSVTEDKNEIRSMLFHRVRAPVLSGL